MQKLKCFPYSWCIDEEEEDVTSFRIYGIDKENKNVCLRITNFTPFIYLELPENIPWTENKAQLLCNKLDSILGDQKPLVKRLMYKKKLYYAHLTSNKKIKTFPYLFLSFSHYSDIRNMSYKIRQPVNIVGVGTIKLKMHEQDASPILQFTSYRNISTAGWLDFTGKIIKDEDKLTLCDHEFKVNWKHVTPNNDSTAASPLIMGFDIEVNSTNPSAMPKAEKPGDKIFQISCVLFRHGSDNMEKFLLTLGEPDPNVVGTDTEILMFETEHDLLIGYSEFIQTYNPNVIVGYNILNFDIPYMIERAKMCYCIFEFDKQGFTKNGHAKEKTIKWWSSAYGHQTFQFLDAEGRLYVDLLPLIKRDYKMDNYKLKTISTFFLGQTKDPLSVKGIFKCYRIGITKNEEGIYSKKSKRAMAICGKYCVQDSVLVIKLFDKLKSWISLCEMASTCNVPIFYLYTQGQQIKVYSQLYKYCMYNNYVVEKDGYIPKDDDHYVGATVFEPVAGVYDKVLPFDFASLYPTTIIAYNIDYSTLVVDPSIPDEDCHVMEWEDHVSCEHDKTVRKTKSKHVMCCKRKFRFLKSPRGVMPSVLQNLLDARARTRSQMKVIAKILEEQKLSEQDEKMAKELDILDGDLTSDKKLTLKKLSDVLENRQIAYKISANSMYGAMGVTKGYLPFMPGAMATTAMGRKNINIVSEVIPKQFGGQLVYGDTDSNYIIFPHLKTASENWDYAIHVAKEVSKLFPSPIKLEFEMAIYWRFFILTKKRYMYKKCGRDGIVEENIGKKGVLLARRDNSMFIRNVYSRIIMMVFNKVDRDEILMYAIDEINKLCSHFYSYKDFVVTKSVGNSGSGQRPVPFINDKGQKKGKLGDYTVPLLSINEKEKQRQFKLKDCKNETDYYSRCLPSVVQLAEKMKKRGNRVDSGTRLEYVITTQGGHKAKQYVKVEDATYFGRFSSTLKLDYMYYLKLITNPLDDIFNILYQKDENKTHTYGGKTHKFIKNFVLNQYNYRLKIRTKVHDELLLLFNPRLILEK
jgi:DNA polymerase elongation subunit (family B)